jgi:flagellar hook-basal body complex protein FliE
MEARPDPGKSFGDMVENGLKSAVEIGNNAERMSAAGIAGKAELADVVTAVNNAEITLQTVMAIRDKVIQAYQEIVRMPI